MCIAANFSRFSIFCPVLALSLDFQFPLLFSALKKKIEAAKQKMMEKSCMVQFLIQVLQTGQINFFGACIECCFLLIEASRCWHQQTLTIPATKNKSKQQQKGNTTAAFFKMWTFSLSSSAIRCSVKSADVTLAFRTVRAGMEVNMGTLQVLEPPSHPTPTSLSPVLFCSCQKLAAMLRAFYDKTQLIHIHAPCLPTFTRS